MGTKCLGGNGYKCEGLWNDGGGGLPVERDREILRDDLPRCGTDELELDGSGGGETGGNVGSDNGVKEEKGGVDNDIRGSI